MTEYTSSPEAIIAYHSSRERTAYWVESSNPTQFLSPSVAPTILPSEVPGTPSDAGSSHSLPPTMVLRWPNSSRPDIPIPNSQRDPDFATSLAKPGRESSHRHHREKSVPLSEGRHRDHTGSSKRHGSSASKSRHRKDIPEEIRILPSQDAKPSVFKRSKSLPRSAHMPNDTHSTYAGVPPVVPPPVPVPWHGYHQEPQRDRSHVPHTRKNSAPAIVYTHDSPLHYNPPDIYSQRPQFGPNGVIYSYSAPVQGQPFPTQTHHKTSRHEHRSSSKPKYSGGESGSRYIEHSGSRRRPPALDLDALDEIQSNGSEGTYYVVPRTGQKVVIASPDHTLYTPTSTTKSPVSPQSGTSTTKKPFFQRLWNMARTSSNNKPSAKGLVRRHSEGGGDAQRPVSR